MATANQVKQLSKADVIAMLRRRRGDLTLRGWSREIGVSFGYLADVLAERRDPGPSILAYLNLEKVETVAYRPCRRAA